MKSKAGLQLAKLCVLREHRHAKRGSAAAPCSACTSQMGSLRSPTISLLLYQWCLALWKLTTNRTTPLPRHRHHIAILHSLDPEHDENRIRPRTCKGGDNHRSAPYQHETSGLAINAANTSLVRESGQSSWRAPQRGQTGTLLG